jgi:hypothetical protein
MPISDPSIFSPEFLRDVAGEPDVLTESLSRPGLVSFDDHQRIWREAGQAERARIIAAIDKQYWTEDEKAAIANIRRIVKGE